MPPRRRNGLASGSLAPAKVQLRHAKNVPNQLKRGLVGEVNCHFAFEHFIFIIGYVDRMRRRIKIEQYLPACYIARFGTWDRVRPLVGQHGSIGSRTAAAYIHRSFCSFARANAKLQRKIGFEAWAGLYIGDTLAWELINSPNAEADGEEEEVDADVEVEKAGVDSENDSDVTL
ncbi:hypothetical protein VNI00_014994 [Paramarasmius palmivorus]|uniref:Uncharacterized protein n=1 Tax=Paramarasmius palmivorus TaxID=297713 RepID=A0AAW0BPG4_9AGAR